MRVKETWRRYSAAQVKDFLRVGYEGRDHPSRLKTIELLDGMIVTGRERAAAVLPWLGAAVLVFAVVVAPYVWYLAEVWGHVTLSGKIDHNLPLSIGTAPGPSPLPMRVLENVLLFQKYAVPDLLPWILLLLVLPGVLARGRTTGWLGRDAVLLIAALPPFASLAFHVEPRIFLPILPFILPFAAVGTLWAAVTLTDARRGWRWSLAMREVTSGRIATFSVGFGSAAPSYDELPYARLVAQRFATDHHEEILEPDVGAILPDIVRAFDEPFADSSAIATYVVAQSTARHVKVALSGIGGDEAFGGYPRYLGLRVAALHARLPGWARRVSRSLAARLPDSASSRNLADWARRFTADPDAAPGERYVGWTRFFGDAELAGLMKPALAAHVDSAVDEPQRQAFATAGHGDPVDGAFRVDLTSYLPDDLLTMADRMSMASSLEVRAPFCDHRIIEESLRLSPRAKMPGGRLKGLLKKAFAGVLPAEVLTHRKQGFMIPLGAWLRGDLRPTLDDLLAPDCVQARGLFEVGAVEILKREHLSGARTHADRLWTLMMLELWMREYLDDRGRWSLR